VLKSVPRFTFSTGCADQIRTNSKLIQFNYHIQ